jgi:hypothetical protein
MLSIQHIAFYKKLVDEKNFSPINCPFDKNDVEHIVISKVDQDYKVYFECLYCNTTFRLGLNAERKILSAIEKHINSK